MNIKLKDSHVLTAYCARPTGEARYSELDLNEFLGVRKGKSESLHHSPYSISSLEEKTQAAITLLS